jgi:hypothetical protein
VKEKEKGNKRGVLGIGFEGVVGLVTECGPVDFGVDPLFRDIDDTVFINRDTVAVLFPLSCVDLCFRWFVIRKKKKKTDLFLGETDPVVKGHNGLKGETSKVGEFVS